MRLIHCSPSLSFVAPLAAAALALTPALGCVTQGTHRNLVQDQQRLENRYADLQASNTLLQESLESLEVANDGLRADKTELQLELRSLETRVSQMQGTYDSLVTDLHSELSSGAIQIEQLRNGIRLNVSQDVLFPSGSAHLDARGEDVIGRVAKQIRETGQRVDVIGHTDNVAISSGLATRFPTNWELAGARAAQVVRHLQEGGLEGERLNAVSKGPFSPVASNDTDTGRRKNRRIEIRLYPNDGPTSGAATASTEATSGGGPASRPDGAPNAE